MAGHEIHNYLAVVMEAVSEANRYFAAQEPWSLKKDNPQRMGTILYVTAEVVRQAAILLQPVIPQGAHNCWTRCVWPKRPAISPIWVRLIG